MWLQERITDNNLEFITNIITAYDFCLSNGNIWIAANQNICLSHESASIIRLTFPTEILFLCILKVKNKIYDQ